MNLVVAGRDHPQRSVLERTVREVFFRQYGAAVSEFPGRLIATVDSSGRPLAVAGLRFREDGFFSECYLDAKIESVLSATLGRPVLRDHVVEFSGLVAVKGGAAKPLIAAGIGLSLAAGCRYGMFTATAGLRALLRRSELPGIELTRAVAGRVRDPASWGSYYLHDPRLLVVPSDGLPKRFEAVARAEAAGHA